MKRVSRSVALAVVGLGALSASVLAGNPRGAKAERSLQGLGYTERCLATMELSPDQKAAVQSVLESNKAVLRADVAAMKASERKLNEDIAKGADKCVVGQDVLDHEASGAKVRGNSAALRTRILALLTPEQQAKLTECGESRSGLARHPEPRPRPTPTP